MQILCKRIFCVEKYYHWICKGKIKSHTISNSNTQYPTIFISGCKADSVPDILYRNICNCIRTKNMPGSAQNPWATELKTRKKSASRKRSVPGKKGNAIIKKMHVLY